MLTKKDIECQLNWYDHQIAQAIENRRRFVFENHIDCRDLDISWFEGLPNDE